MNNLIATIVFLVISMQVLLPSILFAQNTLTEKIEEKINQEFVDNILWMPSTEIESQTKLQVGLKKKDKILFSVYDYKPGEYIQLETIIPVETYSGRLDFDLFVGRHHEDFNASFEIHLITTLKHGPENVDASTIGHIVWEDKPYIDVSGIKIRFATLATEQILKQINQNLAEFHAELSNEFNF